MCAILAIVTNMIPRVIIYSSTILSNAIWTTPQYYIVLFDMWSHVGYTSNCDQYDPTYMWSHVGYTSKTNMIPHVTLYSSTM